MPSSDAPNARADDGCVSVHIRFAPSQGCRLQRPTSIPVKEGDSLWVERPVLMARVDGSYDLIGTTARPKALARWVLSHGGDAEVTEPERLRRRVVAEARRIVRQYASEELEDGLT